MQMFSFIVALASLCDRQRFSCQKELYLHFETVTNVFRVLFQLIKSKGLYSINRGCLSYFILTYDK